MVNQPLGESLKVVPMLDTKARAEIDGYLRQWRGVCPAILQYGMRINLHYSVPHNFILARQRALGLRKIARYMPKAQRPAV